MPAGATVVVSAATLTAANNSKHKSICLEFVKGYTHAKATVPEMKQYSECITRIYPENSTNYESALILGFAVCLVLILVYTVSR